MAALATLRSRSYIAVSITSAGDSGSLDRDLLCFISNTSNLVCLERGRLRRASERENGRTTGCGHGSRGNARERANAADVKANMTWVPGLPRTGTSEIGRAHV